MLYDVFISYAREDRSQADSYYQYLTDAGLDVWYDGRADNDSSVFDQMGNALRRSSFMLLLWSKHAHASNFVVREVMLAEELGRKIIPVKLDNRGFPAGVRLILTGSRPLNAQRTFPEAELSEIASRIAPKPRGGLAPVFLLLNMKGGVGKTTLAANLAGTFHASGKSVLLIDLDAQANLSNLLVSEQQYVESVSVDRSVISCFENSLATGLTESAAGQLFHIDATGLVPTPTRLAFNLRNPLAMQRIDLIIGQFELFKFSLTQNYPQMPSCRHRFLEFVRTAQRQYDIVVLDAAPSNSFLTECAIEAATDIIAPTTPDKYAWRGIQAIGRLMEEGLQMETPRPVHVVLNNVPADVSKAEQAIVDAYPNAHLPVRIRDSQYFKVRNGDPNLRVRDPLGELACIRGSQDVKLALRKLCSELIKRSGANGQGDTA